MLSKQIRAICEKLDWNITQDEEDIELEKCSPTGEDFVFIATEANFVDDVKQYAADFDPNEHVEMWVKARASGTKGIPSVVELVDDARAIDKMLQELAAALAEAETNA